MSSSEAVSLIITNKRNSPEDEFAFVERLVQKRNIEVGVQQIIPRNEIAIRETLDLELKANRELILITGGTGIGPEHRTVDVISSLADFEVPGFGELMRRSGAKSTIKSYLGRCGGWVKDGTLIIAISSNKQAMREQLSAVEELIPEALNAIGGRCKDRRTSGKTE
jgi:molybdopterin biosynthesis enzyme MoaB